MTVQEQIEHYIEEQAEPKRSDMRDLHGRIIQILPDGKLWFDSGTNSEGKVVSNPTIGYGHHTIRYADGKTRDFFQVGLSANKTGLSVYILGIEDKTYLVETFGKTLGKASVTGYCIRFRALKDIDVATLESAIRYGFARPAWSRD